MKNFIIFGWLGALTLFCWLLWYRQNLIIDHCNDNANMVVAFVETYHNHGR